MFVCVCVCACLRACIHVCVCACMRARARACICKTREGEIRTGRAEGSGESKIHNINDTAINLQLTSTDDASFTLGEVTSVSHI